MNAQDLKHWSDSTTLFGTGVTQWLLAVAVALLVYLGVTLALRVAMARLKRVATRSRTHVDDAALDVFGGTSRTLIAVAAALVGFNMLELSPRWHERLDQLWFVAIAIQLALWGGRAVSLLLDRYVHRHAPNDSAQASATATLLSWGLRTALWSVVALAILSNLGVDITAFIASLGVGGIAVALAVQNVLGDLLASLAIAVDKPFEVGDFIVYGDVSGSVEHVGLKSTRIRSLSGEQIVASNTELLKQTIHNYKRLAERRVVFKFGVTYDTTPEQAQQVPELVKRIITARPQLRFDRAHLTGFGESSLDYEVVYYVVVADYNLYMDEQQGINLELMRGLKQLGVEFAFPTRTVVLARPEEQDAESRVFGHPSAGRAH